MTTRYTSGGVTVTLSGELEEFVRRAVDQAAGATVRVMEAAAEEVAADARSWWYAKGTGVTRRTGRSGDVEVVTTVSDEEIRVTVASTDTTTVRDARGRSAPRAAVIFRPGVFSTRAVEISETEYKRQKARGKPHSELVFHAKRSRPASGVEAGKYYREESNPDASDGRYLVPELIQKPMRVKVKVITPELGRAIAARMGR
jgi:hypothetical protein